MRATPLPVSIALAGHTKDRRARNVTVTSMTAHVRMAARICGTLTWKPRATWPSTWIVMMTAATCRRGSRVFGRITGYVLVPSTSVRLVTCPPRRPRRSARSYDRGRRSPPGRRWRRVERSPHAPPDDHVGGVHGIAVGRAPLDDRERVGVDGRPGPGLAVGPVHPELGPIGIPEPDVDPAELPAGVTAADGDLVDGRAIADPRLDPRADGVDVRARLVQAHRRPRAHRLGCVGVAPSDVAPQRDRRVAVDDDEVEQPVEVEVDEGGASRPLVADDPGGLGPLDEACRRAGRSAGCWGHGSRSPPPPRRCPWRRTGRRRPSLLTSANSSCHAVDGRTSPPVNGRCAVAPRSSAMSS